MRLRRVDVRRLDITQLFGLLSESRDLGTVFVFGSIKIRIHSAECGHGFAHVHVWTPDGEAVVFLEGDHDPINAGRLRDKDLAKAIDIVETHRELLMTVWRRLRPK